jgi:hypothetical protein
MLIETAARVMVVPNGTRFPDGQPASLALRWPESGPREATIQSGTQIEPGLFGQARVGERPAAVLATRRPLDSEEPIRCSPSQEISLVELIQAMPFVAPKALEWLRFLPVLVAP